MRLQCDELRFSLLMMYGGILRSRSKSLTTRIAYLCMNESLPTGLDPKYPPGQKWFHQLLTLPSSRALTVGLFIYFFAEVQELVAPERGFLVFGFPHRKKSRTVWYK